MTDVNYVFSAEPRPVQVIERKKPLYRDVPANIMFDKRVVRGPTFRSKADLSATITPLHPQPKPSKPHSTISKPPPTLPSPSPLPPSVSIQTDDYLEELTDEIFDNDMQTQTDPSLLPPTSLPDLSSLYVPRPRGLDAATAIEGTELFDFETAVIPLLSSLTARALDQSLIEVREEEELHHLLTARRKYERERDLTFAEVQRLQAEYERKVKEKEKRFHAERERQLKAQHEAQQRQATEAAERAREAERREEEEKAKAAEGDPMEEEVKAAFIPWLMEQVRGRVEEEQRGVRAVEELLRGGVEAIREEVRREEERRERVRREEEERQRLEREAEEERRRLKEAEERAAKEKAEAERLAAEAAEEAANKEEDEEEEEED